MANRWFQQFAFGLEKYPVRLPLTITATATPATGLQTLTNAKGVVSVTGSGTATWTILLQDTYYKLLGVNAVWAGPAAGSTAPADDAVVIDSVDTNVETAGGGVVTIYLTAANTITVPNSGDILYLELVLSNSSAT